jgi:hypothetical protein
MFRKKFLFICLLGVLLTKANGQTLTVDSYIFKEQPDTAIRSFLRLYTPSLSEKQGNPADAATGKSISLYTFEIHSFIFTKHPFFASTFTNGKLELYCQRHQQLKDTQVYDVKLWLEFDTQQDAEIAFSKMVETFIPISTSKRFSSASGYQKAEFSDNRPTKGFNKVQFRLTADNLDKHRFKILFETENDL